jgi:hypothetical protein
MWQIRTFRTRENMEKFIKKNRIQWHEIFLYGKYYAIEYRRLIRIY